MLSELQRNEICQMYLSGRSKKEIANFFNINETSVSYWLKKKGIKIRPRDSGKYQKHPYNISFFQKDSCELFYFYGFVLGDGCFIQNKNRNIYQISIQVKECDDLVLKKFCDWSNRSYDSINYSKGMSQLRFSSTYLFKDVDLSKWGIVPNKTYNPTKPTISAIKPFIIGLIDADGHISYNNGSYNRSNVFSLTCSKPIIEWFTESLTELGYHGSYRVKNYKSFSRYEITKKNDIVDVVKLLEPTSCFHFERKWGQLYKYL